MPMNNDEQIPAIPVVDVIAEAAKAGAVRKLDVAGERAKPTFMGQEEFAERLRKYALWDYLYTDEPYHDLLECSRAQPGLFEQLAAVLMDVADAQANTEGKTRYKKHITDEIAIVRDVYLPGLTEAASILDYINRVENDPDKADKVSVLPLMCGSGKSTAITLKIKEVIEREDDLGMLLITDSKKRLDEIWNENTDNQLLGDDVRSFIREHKNDVTIMTSDTYEKAVQRQRQYPVLAMTTQRFFNVLTKEEIQTLLTWKDDGTRPLILFDEEPYLNEIIDLTPKTVNDIDTMLHMVLHEGIVSREDKQWCIRQWTAFRAKFLSRLWEYEYDHEGNIFYFEDDTHSLTEDDDRFFSIINQCKTGIRSDNAANFKNLYALKTFVDNWAIYTHRDAGAYESKFTVFFDNSYKVRELGAKVIVLDGTGDISPTYEGQDYIDMRNGQGFLRSLSHLKIKIVDIDTSKAAMHARKSPVPDTVMAYLDEEGYPTDGMYIFTYKDQEKKFLGDKTAHFGAIKGSNDYSDETCIAQVGLNELQPVHYLVHMLARDDEMRSTLAGHSPEESFELIQSIMEDGCTEIKIRHILADIDQNMFRSAIRSAKNRKDVAFYLFYKQSHMPQLLDAIRSRYCGLLGGNIEIVNNETMMQYAPPVEDTKAAGILEWYQEWDGSLIKREDILSELGMSANTFKTTVNRDARLKELFDNAKANAVRAGKSRGWYAK